MLAEKITLCMATPVDAATIARLSRDDIEYGLPWSWTPARVERAIRHRDVNVVVAKQAQVLVGFGIMQYGDQGANLNLLGVSKDQRRLGTGTHIVEWLERVAVNAGIFDIVVQLRQQNVAAKAFYQGLGFEVIDHLPGYYGNHEVAIVMAKNLSALKESGDR